MAKNVSTILVTPVTTEKAYGLSQKMCTYLTFHCLRIKMKSPKLLKNSTALK